MRIGELFLGERTLLASGVVGVGLIRWAMVGSYLVGGGGGRDEW